jgi:hypothetical protein
MPTKKYSAVLAISILILVGAGCGKNPSPGTEIESKGAWQSIKDAFDRSIAVRCDYTDEDGEKTITYIKNKRIYFESEPQPTAGEGEESTVVKGLAKDDKMYIWSEGSAKGLMFDFKNPVGDSQPKMGDKEIRGTQDIIDKLEENKSNCRSESIPDAKFELPAIEFVSF